MLTASGLRINVDEILSNGQQIRFKYFNVSISGADYDDAATYTQSGNDLWTSGLIFPFNTYKSSYNAFPQMQGRVLDADKVIYINGNIPTSGVWQVGIDGSPSRQEYRQIENGVQFQLIGREVVYKKLFCKLLAGGSFINE